MKLSACYALFAGWCATTLFTGMTTNLIQLFALALFCLYKSCADETEKSIVAMDTPEYIYSSEYRLVDQSSVQEENAEDASTAATTSQSRSNQQIRIRNAG